jgi:hypothetical protein
MVAQVKMHMVPIGRPDIQRLYGVAQTEGAVSVFFSLTDYTRDAKAWADQVGMALFRFSPAGEAESVNEYAAVLLHRANHRTPSETSVGSLWGLPLGCSDEMARRALTPKREGLRRKDRILWVRQGWLPCASVSYDYSYLHVRGRKGQKKERLFAQITRPLELITGGATWFPNPQGNMVKVDRMEIKMRERYTPEGLVSRIEELWDHLLTLHQPAAVERDWNRLSTFGVPREALTLRVTSDRKFALPFFAALIENPAGQRFAIAEGVAGTIHNDLSATFTRNAPELMTQIQSGRTVAEN